MKHVSLVRLDCMLGGVGVGIQCIHVNSMMDWQLLHPTLEPLTSDSIAKVCATLNLDSTFLDLGISRAVSQKRQKDVVPTPYEGPEELAVREAANRCLEAVLREAFLWRKKVMFLHPRIYDVSLTFRLSYFFLKMSCFLTRVFMTFH